jgi:hypothetical protein
VSTGIGGWDDSEVRRAVGRGTAEGPSTALGKALEQERAAKAWTRLYRKALEDVVGGKAGAVERAKQLLAKGPGRVT